MISQSFTLFWIYSAILKPALIRYHCPSLCLIIFCRPTHYSDEISLSFTLPDTSLQAYILSWSDIKIPDPVLMRYHSPSPHSDEISLSFTISDKILHSFTLYWWDIAVLHPILVKLHCPSPYSDEILLSFTFSDEIFQSLALFWINDTPITFSCIYNTYLTPLYTRWICPSVSFSVLRFSLTRHR